MRSDSHPPGSYHGPEINDWVRRAQAGDQEALSQLIQRFSRDVYGKAFSILKKHHDTEDVVQETFLRVFKSLPSFRFESSFRTWLITVTIRQSLNYLTRQRRVDTSLDAHAEALGEHPALLQAETQFDQALDEEQLRRLRDALKRLPPRQQEALTLRLETGSSYELIAEAMGTSVGSVKSHIHHAIRHLSQSLGKP
jgi:RNA polymerase sigma-70 factor (ECF subfamily)